MVNKLFAIVVAIGLVFITITASAATHGEERKTTVTGKVTDITGNVVTVRDSEGREKKFKVNSAPGLKVGADAWCEDDNCRKGVRKEDKMIKPQKRSPQPIGRDHTAK